MNNQISKTKDLKSSLYQLLKDQDWSAILVLVLITAVASGLIFYRRIIFPTNNDYSTHILYAQYLIGGEISKIPDLNLAHPGLQGLLAGLYYLTFRIVGLYGLLILVLIGAQVLTALILYFSWFDNDQSKKANWQRVFWAFTLTIVAPVMLLEIWDRQFYFGYIGLANYHNPTIVMLRPLALLSFPFAIKIFNQTRSSKGSIIVSAILIMLSTLIKPNYAITILLGLACLVGLQLLTKKPIDWRMLSFGFIIPASLILSVQWIFLFLLAGSGNEGILILPFEVESAFSGNLFAKFLLSILFPFSVFLLFFRIAIKKVDIQLAWLTFLAGVFQMYFLAEAGERLYHGNFRWSAQISLFLLFAVTARFLYHLEYKPQLKGKRAAIFVTLIYLAHAFAGTAYYLHTFFSKDYG